MSQFTVDYVTYTVIDGSNVNVSGSDINAPTDWNLTIPSTVINNTQSYNVVTILTNTFKNNTKLVNVNIPTSITSISGNNVFQNCSNLTSVSIPNTMNIMNGTSIFAGSGLKYITIPNSITNLGGSMFSGCSSLTGIQLSNTLRSLSTSLFINCSNLNNVLIPNTITIINNSVFQNCTSLTSIILPTRTTGTYTIGSSVFSGCTNLRTVSISPSITSIGTNCFSSCPNLIEVTFSGTTIPTILTNNFTSNTNDTAYCVSGVTNASTLTSFFRYIQVPISQIQYLVDFSGGYSTAVGFDGSSNSITNISIPSSVSLDGSGTTYNVTSIGTLAFNGCSAMTIATIGTGITSIGDSAFNGCTTLSSVTFSGTTIPTIGTSCFTMPTDTAYCVTGVTNASNLTSFFRYIQVPISQVKYLVDFSGGYSTAVGYDGSLTTMSIPSSVTLSGSSTTYNVTSIAANSFNGCSLMTIATIGKNITNIGDSAFATCTSLTSVTFSGIIIPTIGTNNFTILGDTAYCVVGVTNAETLTSFFTNISIPSVVGVQFF